MHDLQGSRILQFGLYELDLRAGELRKDGLRLRLQEQPLRVLGLLLRQPGEIVTRDEIHKEIWGSQTFVDFDHGLNKAISKLRNALNDNPASPRYIETVARRGYRFLAPVVGVHSRMGGRSGAGKVRIAILPFLNLTGDPRQEIFADGLTEEVILQSGQLRPDQLSVIARTSVMLYKGTAKGVQAIGEELQAEYVLEGSIRTFQNRVHISAQLVQVADESYLWSESFELDLGDPFTVQRDAAQSIGESIARELVPQAQTNPVAETTTSASVGHETLLHTRLLWNRRTEIFVREAIRKFSEKTRLEPGNAVAYAELAKCYAILGWYGTIAVSEAGERGSTAVHRAMQIDASSAEVQCSVAILKFWYEWNWTAAEVAFRRALEKLSRYPAAHYWYGMFLHSMGRYDEAERTYRRAAEIDPKSLAANRAVAEVYLYRREYAKAIALLNAILDREPSLFSAHYDLGRVYLYSGRYSDAIAEFETAMELSGNLAGTAALGCALAKAGRKEEALAILDDLRDPSCQRGVAAAGVVSILVALKEFHLALEQLEQAFERRCFWLVDLGVDPSYDSLRPEPRFRALLQRMKLPNLFSMISSPDFPASR